MGSDIPHLGIQDKASKEAGCRFGVFKASMLAADHRGVMPRENCHLPVAYVDLCSHLSRHSLCPDHDIFLTAQSNACLPGSKSHWVPGDMPRGMCIGQWFSNLCRHMFTNIWRYRAENHCYRIAAINGWNCFERTRFVKVTITTTFSKKWAIAKICIAVFFWLNHTSIKGGEDKEGVNTTGFNHI